MIDNLFEEVPNRYITVSSWPVTSDNFYNGAPSKLVSLEAEEDFAIIYRQSSSDHFDSKGKTDTKIVSRFSEDYCRSWSKPFTTFHDPNRNVSEPSVIHDYDRNCLHLFGLSIVPKIDGVDSEVIYQRSFSLRGKNWLPPEFISNSLQLTNPHPFGGGVKTYLGYLTCFYDRQESAIEILISPREKKEWFSATVISADGFNKKRKLTEPVPVRITKERVMIVGRDNLTGDFFTVKSKDGGLSWSEPFYFHFNSGQTPTPLNVEKISCNKFIFCWGDRDLGILYAAFLDIKEFWKNPALLVRENPFPLYSSKCESKTLSYGQNNAGDFGYPSVCVDKDISCIFVSFYDGPFNPEIWVAEINVHC